MLLEMKGDECFDINTTGVLNDKVLFHSLIDVFFYVAVYQQSATKRIPIPFFKCCDAPMLQFLSFFPPIVPTARSRRGLVYFACEQTGTGQQTSSNTWSKECLSN